MKHKKIDNHPLLMEYGNMNTSEVKNTPVRIGRYKARQAGIGLVVTLPRVFVEDNQIKKSDGIDFYLDGKNRLLICKAGDVE
jgi:hypothetical protein